MSQHEVYKLLSSLDEIDEKLAEVRQKARATDTDSQDLQRLFLLCSSNLNELEKTVSRLRNELTETYKMTNKKLNGEHCNTIKRLATKTQSHEKIDN